jgi:hypothetical protein
MVTLPEPGDLGQWRMHTRFFHGLWTSATTPLEEYWELHALDHQDPGSGCIPHTHTDTAESAATAHGFW